MTKKHGFTHAGVWIQEGLFFIGCFLFLIFRIHPVLILQSQPPVFLKGFDFLSESLKIPGGLTDWFSAFFMQLWSSDFIGSLFLTLCLGVVAILTRRWMETLTENRPVHTFHLIPAALLLVLHCQYDFRLSVTLALIINLAFAILFIRWMPKRQAVRTVLSVTASVLLYWMTGGAFLTFAVLCGLDDLLFKKRIVSGLLLVLVSAVLPFSAYASVFLVPFRQAFLHNLTFENPVKLRIAGYGLHTFYLLALIIASLMKFTEILKPFQKIIRLSYTWKLALGTLLLFSGTILVAQKSGDKTTRLILQVNRLVKEGRWQEVLKSVQGQQRVDPLISCQTNRALFQTGTLLDKMFAYPQTEGTIGLVLNHTGCLAWPEEVSALCLKLGLVGESQHWAHEALELKGATPDILKQLSILYLLKGEREASDRFARTLGKTPFQAKAAGILLQCDGDPSKLTTTDGYASILSYMPTEDFISLGEISSHELELLLERNPKNQMAFEYLIAYHLLSGDLKWIWNHISNFSTFGYLQIPQHVQEALMISAVIIPKFDQSQVRKWIHPSNYRRFFEYKQILTKHQGNKLDAKQDLLKQFGNSYWYYLMFVKPASRQSEYQNEYQ